MATEPGGAPAGPPAISPSHRPPRSWRPQTASGLVHEWGGAERVALLRMRGPAPRPSSAPRALAPLGGARCLPGYLARPASHPVLRRGREIRVSLKMVALGSG